jgi:hypothetical protein
MLHHLCAKTRGSSVSRCGSGCDHSLHDTAIPSHNENNFFLKQRNWTLQRQCHEIFDLWIFFQHTIPSRSLIHALKYLRKNKQICVVPHLYRVCRSRAMQHCVGPWFSAMPHSAGSNFLAMDQLGLLWTHSV